MSELLPDDLSNDHDQRRFRRVRVNLLGRYMLADRREFPCQVLNMSPGGMELAAPVSGMEGERVVAYVDHLGRLEGGIVRVTPTGFTMTISATPRKRDKLAAQLTWLANRHILGLTEDRDRDGIVPANSRTMVTMPNGTTLTCRIVDMSLSGASISSQTVPPIGMAITVGKVQGRVARHIDGGFAVEFLRLQHPDSLAESVTGP